MSIYLVEIDGYDPVSATVKTSYFCTGTGYISGNITYLPRVKQPGHIKDSMYQEGKTGGASAVGYGDVTLTNKDGSLDYLKSYGFDGRKIVIKRVGAFGIAVEFTGTMEQPVPTLDTLSFRVRDKQALLQVPIQPNKYLGNNVGAAGLEGEADLKGKSKPLLYGECHRITPELVNSALLIYQVNEGAFYSLPVVRDDEVVLTPGADYATSALLQAAVVAPATYATCLAEGYFRLGWPVFGTLTCDAIQGATAALRTVAQLSLQIVTRVIPAADVYAQGIIAVDTANSAVAGIYVSGEANVDAVLDEITNTAGCWYSFDGNGKWNLRQLVPPSAAPLLTLTAAEILTLERVNTNDLGCGVPAYKYLLDYDKNNTVQRDQPGYTGMDYRTATPAVDNSVLTKHPSATVLTAKSLLISGAAADAEATRRLGLYGTERDRYLVNCNQANIKYPAGGWWDNTAISAIPTDRYGHAIATWDKWTIVIGGILAGGAAATKTVSRLDMTNPTGPWDFTLPDLPTTRIFSRPVIYNNWLYLLGGLSDGAVSASVIRLDLSNPVAWDDAGVTDMPVARYNFCAVAYSGYLYVAGGLTAADTYTLKTYRLDLANPSGTWNDSVVYDSPEGLEVCAFGVNGSWLYMVGYNPTARGNIMHIWSATLPTLSSWYAKVSDIADWQPSCAFAVLGDWLYMIGGIKSGPYNKVRRINIALSTPTARRVDDSIANLPGPLAYAAAEFYNGSLYVVGGTYDGTNTTKNTLQLRTNDNAIDCAKLTEIGQDICLKINRYGLDNGKNFKIIGREINRETENVQLDVWG